MEPRGLDQALETAADRTRSAQERVDEELAAKERARLESVDVVARRAEDLDELAAEAATEAEEPPGGTDAG
jgi:hypothetical protein